MTSKQQDVKQQKRILLACCICLFMIFSLFNYRFVHVSDISHGKRSSLNVQTQKLIALLPEDLLITVFTDKASTQKQIKKAFSAFHHHKRNIDIVFIDPIENPEQARAAGFNAEKPIQLTYEDKTIYGNNVSELALHNLLLTLLRNDKPWVTFSSGFGERQAYDSASFNYSTLSEHLTTQGFRVIDIDLRTVSNVPENTTILVLAAPTEAYDSNELDKILRFINNGGNVLWLADTDSQPLPEKLSSLLSVTLLDGVLVDANSQKYIQNKPDFIPIDNYNSIPFLHNIELVTVLPQVRGLEIINDNEKAFLVGNQLQSSINSWTETSMIRGSIAFDENTTEVAGPITIGLTLYKPRVDQRDQRIMVLGDADYMANAYIGEGGNLDFATRLFEWLAYQEKLLSIDTISAPDKQLTISNNNFYAISLFYIIILPIALLAIAVYTGYKRKKL